MQITSHLLIILLKVFSKFPLWILYLISDILYFLLYKIVSYRKKVVRQNLKNSFPNKSSSELLIIEKNFYKYLCDLIVETIKLPSLSNKEVQKRCIIHTIEKYIQKFENGESFILVLGHQGNYEWANISFSSQHDFNFYGIFHPLKNKLLNNYFINTRGKFGTKLVPMKEAYLQLKKLKEETSIVGLVSDQSPRPTNAYWTTFLNQDSGFFWGMENLSKEYNIPVVFAHIKRVKRGYYEVFPETIIKNPKDYKEGEITEKYVRKLEEKITAEPETWFWSHRRWKHKKPPISNSQN